MFDQSSGLQKNKHDPVSELLMGMRLRGASYGRLQLSPPFGIRFPAGPEARFHFVARGKVLLRAPGEVGRELACGDAVLLPRGEVHEIVTGSHIQIRDYESYTRKPLCADVAAVEACIKTADRENDTLIFTGRMEFELDTLHPLVGLMPPIMSVVDVKTVERFIDSFIFVIEWGETKRELVEEAFDEIDNVRDRILCVLLNKADPAALKMIEAYKGSRIGNYYVG